MNLILVLLELKEKRIFIDLNEDKIKVKADKEAMTPELKSQLLDIKNDIILLFKQLGINSNKHIAPTSFTQRGLWYVDQLGEGSLEYNQLHWIELNGHLNPDIIEQTYNQILQRHDSLRTTFEEAEGEPYQIIRAWQPQSIPLIDLTHLTAAQQDIELEKLTRQEALKPFDLSKDLMLRLILIKLSEDQAVMTYCLHHIASDGWSLMVLQNEFMRLFNALSNNQPNPLPTLKVQYADYAHWQRQFFTGEVYQKHLDYWLQKLADLPPVHSLPLDYPRPETLPRQGKHLDICLNRHLTDQLNHLCKQQNVTQFMALHALLALTLSRYSGEPDIVMGTPIANRENADTRNLIGFFANTLVLRTHVSDCPDFIQLLQRSRKCILDAYEFQNMPFQDLVNRLAGERSASYDPLFQIMLVLQPSRQHNDSNHELFQERKAQQPRPSHSSADELFETAMFDLHINVIETTDGLTMTWQYNKALFRSATIQQMAQHFIRLTESAIQTPNAPLPLLPMLDQAETDYLLNTLNNTQAAYPQDRCIHELFEQQVAIHPNQTALVFEQESLTFRQLNQRANQLAHYLVARHQVTPDTLVGICMERSTEMVIAMLGILKSGAAYLPLDPDYPPSRLQFMLQDAKVLLVLNQSRLNATLPDYQGTQISLDQTNVADMAQYSTDNLPVNQVALTPRHMAYVIYTSGSTGKPKGVMLSHSALVNRIHWMNRTYGMSADDKVLQKTPYSFDVSVWEFFWPLAYGGCLVMAEPEGHKDPEYLRKVIAEQNISILHFVPSMLRTYLEINNGAFAPNVRDVFCSGEALEGKEVKQVHEQAPHVTLHNLYGPTEAAIDVTAFDTRQLTDYQHVPIGKPIDNIQLYILDEHLQPVPKGCAGELHISGAGLARGYLNRPELTAQRFIANPFIDQPDIDASTPSEKLYKTGDLVRYLPDNNIAYLGRIDHQVKIRGFRIELGEIEYQLDQHPDIDTTLVNSYQHQTGEQQLVAYLKTNAPQKPDIEAIRNWLRSRLPDYMQPTFYVVIEEFPLNANGKVDRNQLPAPNVTAQIEAQYVAPQTALQQQLCTIWQESLELEKIGINDNFFTLGGTSLVAVKTISKAKKQGLNIAIKQLWQNQTIAELAKVIEQQILEQREEEELNIDATAPIPLFPAQYRFVEGNNPDPHHFNSATMCEIRIELDQTLLGNAIMHLLEKNDALRMKLYQTDHDWFQTATDMPATPPLALIDIKGTTPEAIDENLREYVQQFQRSLNIYKGELIRFALFTMPNHQPPRLLFICHHLVTDGISMNLILDDLISTYQKLSTGDTLPAIEEQSSYAHAAKAMKVMAQNELKSEFEYWDKAIPDVLPPLPVDFNSPQEKNRFKTVHFFMDKWVEAGPTQTIMYTIPEQEKVHSVAVVLHGLALFVAQWNNNSPMLIDLMRFGRETKDNKVDLSECLGWHANTTPFFIDSVTAKDHREAIKKIHHGLESIPYSGTHLGYLKYLSGDQHITQKLRNKPHPELMLNFFPKQAPNKPNEEDPSLKFLDFNLDPYVSPENYNGYKWTVWVSEIEGRLGIGVQYSDQFYKNETIDRLIDVYIKQMNNIAAWFEQGN